MLIIKAKAEYLYNDCGEKLIDLFSAHGAVSLGHSHPDIVKALNTQIKKVWLTGGWPTNIQQKASKLLASFFPKTYETKVFYSTGMEAVEFALRAAKVYTGKRGIISFEGDMHGKSAETAALGWDNPWQDTPPEIYRLPSLRSESPEHILQKIEKLISEESIAAIIIEPYQCSNGGFSFSKNFYTKLVPLCRDAGVLIIFDEILTGFYRTGSLFCFSKLGFVPDIILLGKALGNGFPVSAVVMRKDIEIKKEMLSKSTFADNPLAATVVTAVLKQYNKNIWLKKAEQIGQMIYEQLSELTLLGVELRGTGACWILELPQERIAFGLAGRLCRCGVAVNQVGNYIRLLPPLIIKTQILKKVCLCLVKELKSMLINS